MGAWVRSPAGTYWHIPRTATVRADGAVCAHMWCGQMQFNVTPRLEPPEDPTRCGTCVGRYLGWRAEHGLTFDPHNPWDLPKRCPFTAVPDRQPCPYCGNKAKWSYRYYYATQVEHRPGPTLVEWVPCHAHGWSDMGTDWNGRVRCRSRLGPTRECGNPLRRRVAR